MDKETLSNYGWIVICVLVLAVMIALATPFGEYVKEAVWSTTQGLFDTGENALNTVGISSKKPQPKNLFEGHTWSKTSDSAAKSTNISISSEGGLELGKTYALQCEFNPNLAKNLTIIYRNSNLTQVKSEKVLEGNVKSTFIFTIPEDDSIAYVSFHTACTAEADDGKVIPTKTVLYELEALKDAEYNLAGKTMLVFGDSIAAGGKNYYSYVFQIADRNYMNLVNRAKSGAKITQTDGSAGYILQQVEAADASINPDVILLNALTNDINSFSDSTAVGAISESFDSELDIATFCGAFEATIKAIQEKWEGVPVIFVTPHINGAKDENCQERAVELALEMCEKWDVTVADIYHESGLNTFDEDMTAMYGYDRTHPNTLGHKTFYVPIVEEKIKEVIK